MSNCPCYQVVFCFLSGCCRRNEVWEKRTQPLVGRCEFCAILPIVVVDVLTNDLQRQAAKIVILASYFVSVLTEPATVILLSNCGYIK